MFRDKTHSVVFHGLFILVNVAVVSVWITLQMTVDGSALWGEQDRDNKHEWAYCEEGVPSAFCRTRMNGVSSLAYCAVGIYMMMCGLNDMAAYSPHWPSCLQWWSPRGHRRNRFMIESAADLLVMFDGPPNLTAKHPTLSFVEGGLTFINGVASVIGHCCDCGWGYRVSEIALLQVILFQMFVTVAHLIPSRLSVCSVSCRSPCLPILTLVFAIASVVVSVFAHVAFHYVFAIVLVGTLATVAVMGIVRPSSDIDHPVLAVVGLVLTGCSLCFVLPEAFLEMCPTDINGMGPRGFIQLHAAWHVSFALVVLCSYMYRRSINYPSLFNAFMLYSEEDEKLCLVDLDDIQQNGEYVALSTTTSYRD